MSLRLPTVSLAALLGFAACATDAAGPAPAASVPAASVSPGPVPSASAASADRQDALDAAATEAVVGAGGPAAAAQDPEPAAEQPTEAAQASRSLLREIWDRPGFKRQVARSWLRGGETEPPLTLREDEFRREVLQLIADEDEESAASRLQSLQGSDATAVWDFMLGNLYYGQEQYVEAQRELSKAAAKYPNYLRAWKVLGYAQMRTQKWESAAESLAEVISIGGADAFTYGLLANAHVQSGSWASAESAVRYVMMMDPREGNWPKLLAYVLQQQRKFADSVILLDTLIAEDRDNPDLWKMQAYAYANMGETDKAATNFEILDRLGAADFQSLSTLGSIYFNDELYSLTVDAYLRAMAKEDRAEHDVALQIAQRLAARSVYDEAARLVQGIEAAYAETLTQESRLSMLKLRARLAVATGATAEQVALLEQIVGENPLDGDALLQLGRHFQNQGDVEKAAFRYEQAARNPEFTFDAKRLHAQMLSSKQRYGEAEKLLEAAITLKPTDSDDVQRLLDYVKRAKARAGEKKSGA